MAAINFPSSPSVNDQFTDAGITWVWTGTEWNVVGSGTPHNPVTIGTPANGLSIDGSQVLTIATASASTVGALTSADWSTFNGKQPLIAGTQTEGYVATIVSGTPTWAAQSGGSSKWTDVGSDIYRDSSVAIGRTTIPTNATFAVQSRTSTALNKFFQLLNNVGSEIFTVTQDGSGQYLGNGGGFSFGNIAPSGNLLRHRSGLNGNSAAQFLIEDSLGVSNFSVDNIGRANIRNQLTVPGEVNIGTAPAIGGGNVGLTVKSTNNGSDSFRIYNQTDVLMVRYQWNVGFIVNGQNSSASTSIFAVFASDATRILTFYGDKSITIGNACNFAFNTTTGTKIGTATSQKLAFWNKTPIVQPTTAITGATKVGGGGTTLTDTDTFGGYTVAQIAQALINTGLLA